MRVREGSRLEIRTRTPGTRALDGRFSGSGASKMGWNPKLDVRSRTAGGVRGRSGKSAGLTRGSCRSPIEILGEGGGGGGTTGGTRIRAARRAGDGGGSSRGAVAESRRGPGGGSGGSGTEVEGGEGARGWQRRRPLFEREVLPNGKTDSRKIVLSEVISFCVRGFQNFQPL